MAVDLNRVLAAYPVGERTVAGEAFESLRAAIVDGSLKPGEPLRVSALAKASRVSGMPIREALAKLARIGLVEMTPGIGTRVAGLSLEDLNDLYDTRLILEVSALEKASANFGDDDSEIAEERLGRLAGAIAAGDRREAAKAHDEFHLALYRADSSTWLPRLLLPLWSRSEQYVAAALPSFPISRPRITEHERLLAACRSGVASSAAAELWNHLASTANFVSRSMGGGRLVERRS